MTLPDGGEVESVYILYGKRVTLCLSSQIGCPLACRFCRDQDLHLALAELLLGEEAAPRLIAQARLHATMDVPDAEAPRLQSGYEIVKSVLELSKEEQALISAIEETLLL